MQFFFVLRAFPRALPALGRGNRTGARAPSPSLPTPRCFSGWIDRYDRVKPPLPSLLSSALSPNKILVSRFLLAARAVARAFTYLLRKLSRESPFQKLAFE